MLLLMIFILLYHLMCEPLLSKTSEVSWIMIVAPIASITIITVALLVAAFRQHEDKDLNLNDVRDVASATINASSGL